MTDEKKYKEHVKKGWCFAQETANEMTSEVEANAIATKPTEGRQLCCAAIEQYLGHDAL